MQSEFEQLFADLYRHLQESGSFADNLIRLVSGDSRKGRVLNDRVICLVRICNQNPSETEARARASCMFSAAVFHIASSARLHSVVIACQRG